MPSPTETLWVRRHGGSLHAWPGSVPYVGLLPTQVTVLTQLPVGEHPPSVLGGFSVLTALSETLRHSLLKGGYLRMVKEHKSHTH